MCVIETLRIPIYNQHFMESYTFSIWIIGLLVLLYWIVELIFIRNIFRFSYKRFCKSINNLFECKPIVKCCKLSFPIAFLMILLSLLTSLLSSTLFLYSSYNPSNITCAYTPIISILLRFFSKHFIWGFNIVRGQMVIEMLQNKYLNIFVQHSQYILTIQMIIIFTMVLIFTSSFYNQTINECSTEIPLILLILIAFIGEFIYGIGFVYIFCKCVTTSMKRVMISLRHKDRVETKKQLIHHLTVYLIQFLLSWLYIISLCSCSNKNTFTNFQIFAAELLISNICVLSLFRGRIKKFKKFYQKYKCKLGQCNKHKNQTTLVKYIESNRKTNIKQTKNELNNDETCIDENIMEKKPVLIPTISNFSNINEHENENNNKDILDNLPQLQLTEIRKRTLSDATTINSMGSPINSPISNSLMRNNSISINPLLPNSWLSPTCIETFRVSLIKPSNLILTPNSDIKPLESIINCTNNYISNSAPMFKNHNNNNKKLKPIKSKSKSTSLLEINGRNKLNNIKFEIDEKEENEFDLKLMTKSAKFNNETINNISNASKSLFKKASILFTQNNNQSQSTPIIDDNYNVEIQYSDDIIKANT